MPVKLLPYVSTLAMLFCSITSDVRRPMPQPGPALAHGKDTSMCSHEALISAWQAGCSPRMSWCRWQHRWHTVFHGGFQVVT